MEEHLRRVQSRVGAGPPEGPIHAVLGGPEPDVNTVAATLCLALHLSQRQPSGGVCVPVLCRKQCGTVLPEETARYLQRVRISESLLLWKEDVDLVNLHHSGKLLLTLLRDGLLDSSERSTLECSILRVVHHDKQRDAADDGALSVLTTVAREILQEASEQSRAALREALGEALRLQREALWIEHGCRSEELEELVSSLEQWAEGRQQDLTQLLAMKLKEFSDGEMTIALTALTTDKEDWQDYVEGLKSFCHQHDYSGLVVLFSVSDSVHHPRQQVAVYSNNTDMLNQICTELEESSSWSLSGELEDTGSLQVYHIPINTSASSGTPPLLEEEIRDLLKNFVDRRSSLLACHPSSRTSSTEGVAGSVEFSQGSSGINDMDGSDVERAEGDNGDVVAVARVTEEDTGRVNVGGEILSPDSGMTTIRSSRSSKESSVFLSDDSPLGEVTASGGPAAGLGGLRNPSPLGFLSLSPPVPPERRKHRSNKNRNDNFNLFSFDPFHSSDQPLPAGGELVNYQSGGDEGERRAGSSSLSELDELSLIDFSAPNSLGGLESGHSSVDHQGTIHWNEMMETMVPPTPVNSLVGSRPPSSCGVRFFPEDVIERINVLQHKDSMSSSLSETWDELSFDTQGALSSTDNSISNRPKSSGSPQMIECENTRKNSDFTERNGKDQISKPEADHQKAKCLEPQLSLVTEQIETCDNWNPDFVLRDQWKPVTLADIQLTPPKDGVTVKNKAESDRMPTLKNKQKTLNTLTPDTSKEEDEGVQGKKKDQHLELLDFWTYSAQQGLLKSDSGTTTSYPESLDMWNMTIRDDSLSPLNTPDNLSENSSSFYGLNPNIRKDTSVESPLGYSDGGMQMWNTTIQEDSSSPLTTPEGPENEKDLSHVGSSDDSLETHPSKQTEEEKASEDASVSKFINEVVEWTGNEHNVKIVIETVDSETQGEETSSKDMQSVQSEYAEVVFSDSPSIHSEDETSPHQSTGMCELPVHGMVTSTSEYDNLGPGAWSQASSPDNCASPVVDMIQLEEQSSPFVAVSKPVQSEERQNLSQTADLLRKKTTLDINQTANQVFLFDREFGPLTKSGESPVDINKNTSRENSEEVDWTVQSSEHSPFVLVDTSTFTQQDSESPRKASGILIQTHQSSSLSCDDWGIHVSEKHSDSESASSLNLHLPIKINQNEAKHAFETQECRENLEDKITEDLSWNYFSEGGREVSKFNSLDTRSNNNLESNSDESFSGLEMENIVVPGTVKEANREWSDKPSQDNKQSKGTGKSMETFSILSCAASVLKTHSKTAHGDHMEISLSQSKTNPEAFSPSDCRPTEEENNKNESSTVARSVSPSLRYPSDHFLKTREEVYVRSQISMEDSDDGGESPSAPPPSATSLGGFQVWGTQLVRQKTQSPVLTNSSVSPSSSLISSPVNESSISTDKKLGLPFSGDLMEEEQDEDLDSDHSVLPKWTQEEQGEWKERHEFESSDLLSFTEDLIAGSSFQQTDLQTFQSKRDMFLLKREDYDHPQPLRTDKWSIEQQSGSYEVSEDIYSPVSRRHQDVTPQLSSQPTDENAAYQSAGTQNTTQGQTKYGYNFHHIDQRTENQSASRSCAETKPESQQQNTTEVYAEFTTDALAKHFRSEQRENQFETGANAHRSLDDACVKCQYAAESSFVDDSACSSELQYSQHQGDEQSHYDSQNVHYQYDGEPFHQSDPHPKAEDHARYVSEGHVHFLLSRNSQQGVDAAGMMMMKMASSEEAAEELDNRDDPPSSADTSGGSNQRRKLSAPPMNVSLEHSEGSLLSEDALDTEDDALDTGDDLDVSVDGIDTPDETESLEFNAHADSEEPNLGEGAASGGATAGHQAEERGDKRLWRSVVIGEQEHRIDMKCIEPYKRVISHGGYYAEKNAIIVFAACFLPDSDCDNYNYVMENLFLYVISTLELMVAEDYMIVYLNGATPRRRMPGFTWMKRCYQMIDRRLKKNLKMFFIVHPSWFVRTLLGITRPFISSKFSSKIRYVNSLKELGELIPMEYVHIPPSIIKLDLELQNTSTKVDGGSSAV